MAILGGGRSLGKWIFRRMMSSSSSASPPWLMLPPASEGGNMVYKFYSVVEERVVSLKKRFSLDGVMDGDPLEIKGSSHGWLCVFNRRNCDMFLMNPVSGRHIKLPTIHTLAIPEENLKGGSGCVTRVILSGSPEEECRAMMTYGPPSRLAFCCPGQSKEWTPIGLALFPNRSYYRARPYEDFVYSSKHQHFFCITGLDSYEVERWDLSNPRSPRLDWVDDGMVRLCYHNWLGYHAWLDQVWELDTFPSQYRYLAVGREELRDLSHDTCLYRYLVFAEELDQLYLVTRWVTYCKMTSEGCVIEDENVYTEYLYLGKTIGFCVHRIEIEEGGKLVESCSLDGLSFFIGNNHSFAMSDPQLKPNSIYFTAHDSCIPPSWDVESRYGGHDIAIFDYENKTFSPCYYPYPSHIHSFKRIKPPPIWFTPTHP